MDHGLTTRPTFLYFHPQRTQVAIENCLFLMSEQSVSGRTGRQIHFSAPFHRAGWLPLCATVHSCKSPTRNHQTLSALLIHCSDCAALCTCSHLAIEPPSIRRAGVCSNYAAKPNSDYTDSARSWRLRSSPRQVLRSNLSFHLQRLLPSTFDKPQQGINLLQPCVSSSPSSMLSVRPTPMSRQIWQRDTAFRLVSWGPPVSQGPWRTSYLGITISRYYARRPTTSQQLFIRPILLLWLQARNILGPWPLAAPLPRGAT